MYSKTKFQLYMCFSLLCFAVIAQILGFTWNTELFIVINRWGTIADDSIWSFLTLMGDTGVLWPILSLLSITSLKSIYSVLAAVPLGGFFSILLKRLFDSMRPAGFFDELNFHVIGPILKTHSFPSGHSITVFAAISAICLTLTIKNKLINAVFQCVLILFALLVSLSRIMVGAHWPIDCVAGASIGWMSGLSGMYLMNRYHDRLNGVRLGFFTVFFLWIISISNFYRTFDYPNSIFAVQLIFVVATVMFLLYIFRQRDSIANLFA